MNTRRNKSKMKKQYEKIDGLDVLSFDVNQRPSSSKRVSCSTQRTVSMGSRSIESDMNSLFDSGYSSFGENKSIYLDLDPPESSRREHDRRYSHSQRSSSDSSDQSPTSLVVYQDSPIQRHKQNDAWYSRREPKDAHIPSPPYSSHQEPRRQNSWLALKQINNKEGNDRVGSAGLATVHTMTGTIPLFEQVESDPKNSTPLESTRRRSSAFWYFSGKHGAVHDESAIIEEHEKKLVKEHKIERGYDFYANEVNAPKAPQHRHPKYKSMKQLCNTATVFDKSSNSAGKKAERSEKKCHQDMNHVHEQAKFFMQGCKMDHFD
jgi:hypothetical protein